MNKNFLGLIEAHVEKGVLGLAVVFLLAMVWMFGLGSPNEVEYNNAPRAPGELSSAILDNAKELKSRMTSAQPDEDAKKGTRDFAKQLAALQSNVLFSENRPVSAPDAKSPPPVKPAAVVTTVPGKPIEIEGLKEAEEINKSIELVTPIPPSFPTVRTGHNLVDRKPIHLGEAPKPLAADTAVPEPVELSWVTVAAYFDKAKQQAELHQAKYSTGRARVYVAGVDVERQELLSSGEWSEWKRIDNSKAMPELTIPQPAIDDRGNLINKTELDEAWATVKAEQQRIMQPPFYPVTSGDMWKMPPLEGYEDPVADEEERPRPRAKTTTERPTRQPRQTGGNPRGGGFRGGGGGTGEIGVAGGGGRFGGRAVGGGGGGGGVSAADKAAAKKEASERLREAKEAMNKKDYGAAMSAAQQVISNEYASAGDKRQAEGIIADAEKKMAEAPAGAPIGEFGGPRGSFGPRGAPMPMGDDPRMAGRMGMGMAMAQDSGPTDLVTHPENKNELAVWFHDDTVEPGKTYQYRMRVNLWNRYMGRIKALKDSEEAKKAVIEGEWSAPSDPVVVAPSTHFYVTSLKPGTETAIVEVWKWRKGTWHKQNFEVSVGEMIGGEKEIKVDDVDAKDGRAKVDFSTGALVLDLRIEEPIQMRLAARGGGYNLADRKSLVLVYLDPADGQVKERVQDFDRADPTRKMLQAQEK